MTFEQALEKVIALEGGFILERNPTETHDTYAGIYRKVFPLWAGWNYIDKNLTPPKELVLAHYKQEFWDKITVNHTIVHYLLFEYGVNAGLGKAKLLAKTVHPHYDNITDDEEVKSFILEFTLGRIKHYTDLANKNPKRYGIYLRGWINRALEALI